MIQKLVTGKISKRPLLYIFLICFVFCLMLIYIVNTHEQAEELEIQSSNSGNLKEQLDHASIVLKDLDSIEKAPTKDFDSLAKDELSFNVEDDEEDFYKYYLSYKEKSSLIDRAEAQDANKPSKDEGEIAITHNNALDEPKNLDESKLQVIQKRKDELLRAMSAPTHVALTKKQNQASDEKILNPLSAYDDFKQTSFELQSVLAKPKSPYTLMQGSVIHARLLTGVSSELPGQIQALVTRDVKDSLTHQYLVIPKGSRLLGQYGANTSFGQERLFLGFNRLIFPNGKTLNLGAMPGSSIDGMTGLDANVNNHFFKTLVSCVLLSAITSTSQSIEQSQRLQNGVRITQSNATRELNTNLKEALSNIIERNLNLSPTLYVKPGFNFTINTTLDIPFKEPYDG